MSNLRAVRYRKLALATKVRCDADLLLKLADECDLGLLCTAEWRSARPSFENDQLSEATNAKARFDPTLSKQVLHRNINLDRN
jgi:hypothetical protein